MEICLKNLLNMTIKKIDVHGVHTYAFCVYTCGVCTHVVCVYGLRVRVYFYQISLWVQDVTQGQFLSGI